MFLFAIMPQRDKISEKFSKKNSPETISYNIVLKNSFKSFLYSSKALNLVTFVKNLFKNEFTSLFPIFFYIR